MSFARIITSRLLGISRNTGATPEVDKPRARTAWFWI
jgi:hypothetical protein